VNEPGRLEPSERPGDVSIVTPLCMISTPLERLNGMHGISFNEKGLGVDIE
jgi:hypothetical protein